MNNSSLITHSRKSRRWAPRHAVTLFAFLTSAPLVTASLWLPGCAADSGDPLKAASSSMVSTPEGGSSPIDSGSTLDQGTFTQPDTSTTTTTPEGGGSLDSGGGGGSDSTTPPPSESGSPTDSSQPPPADTGPVVETGPVDAGQPPPPADGGGCSAGATVITATDPSTATGSGTIANFGTTGAVCVKLMGGISNPYGGWNSSNCTGRTVTLNGAAASLMGAQGTGSGPAVPAEADGYAIWEWSAGGVSYCSMSLF
jgi:hypothetical protein